MCAQLRPVSPSGLLPVSKPKDAFIDCSLPIPAYVNVWVYGLLCLLCPPTRKRVSCPSLPFGVPRSAKLSRLSHDVSTFLSFTDNSIVSNNPARSHYVKCGQAHRGVHENYRNLFRPRKGFVGGALNCAENATSARRIRECTHLGRCNPSTKSQ